MSLVAGLNSTTNHVENIKSTEGALHVNIGLPVEAVLNTRHRVTAAEANAGHELLPAVAGKGYRIINVKALAYGGAAITCTTVDIKGTQAAAVVKLVAFAQASLTQSTVLEMGEVGAAVLANGASFAVCDDNSAITIAVTTNNLAGATGIDVVIDYTLE